MATIDDRTISLIGSGDPLHADDVSGLDPGQHGPLIDGTVDDKNRIRKVVMFHGNYRCC